MIKPIEASDVKHYPHFDSWISVESANELVADPNRVARHKFYPFFLYHDSWQPFRQGGDQKGKPKPKSRPIRYAARKDAYIYTYYRRILSERYEKEIAESEISDCVVAYRKIKKKNGGGKCNIDFAKDAFDEIEKLKNCVAIALDIKGYFENLDHYLIKEAWCRLLGVDRLPSDHFTVFKNVTDYHVVDQKEAYRRLGFLKEVDVNGVKREKYTVSYKKMPLQLCTPEEFRSKICGYGNNLPSIVKGNVDESGNKLDHGIPQGSPISDLIANFYLFNFDITMKNLAARNGGKYMRYSDDILLIVPSDSMSAGDAEEFISKEISRYGERLMIKSEKTCVGEFSYGEGRLRYQHVRGPHGKNGFEYLGFRFDGQKIYVRDSTMSRLYRKLSASAVAASAGYARYHHQLGAEELIERFNYSAFIQRYSKVHDSALEPDNYKTWTFYSYLKRAAEIFDLEKGDKIIPQARNLNRIMRERIAVALRRAVARRDGIGD